jgi:hypothetical protein
MHCPAALLGVYILDQLFFHKNSEYGLTLLPFDKLDVKFLRISVTSVR